MTQSTGFDAAGQGSSGDNWRNQGSTSSGGSVRSSGNDQSGSSFGDRQSGGQGSWMPEGFSGQSGDVMGQLRDFGRNNRAATIGGGILAILALAGYASSSGKRRQEQRYRGNWQSSGRSRYGDDERFRREDLRGGRDYQFGSGRGYSGSYSGGQHSYGGLRRAGRYGMNHPVGLTAGAALGAMALSWLARGWGQQGSSQDRNWQGGSWQQGSDQSFGQDFQGGQTGTTGSGSSFAGSTSSPGSRGFGQGALDSQSFGRGTMGSDAIEAAGSSSDLGQGTTGSSFGRGRTGTTGAL